MDLYEALIAGRLGKGKGGSGFAPTTEQLAAMNSGITSADVEQIGTNADDISALTPSVEAENITLSVMNGYEAGTVKAGYVDGVSGVTGYVTIRTYSEPNGRKVQIMETQAGVSKTRYYNGSEWSEFSVDVPAKLDSTIAILSSILISGAQSWETVRSAVRQGLAAQAYPVGTILYDNWDPATGKAYQVVGIDKHFDTSLYNQGYHHSITLLEVKLNDLVQFSAPQAMFYLSEAALPAGTYRFKIPNWDATYGGNKYYVFTTQGASQYSQITLTWSSNTLPVNVKIYEPSGDTIAAEITTVKETCALTEWDGVTEFDSAHDLGTIKLNMSDPDNSYGLINQIYRARYGSNNYYESGVRQFLNTDKAANAWWEPQTVFDRPNASANKAGRLSTLSADFVSVLATPTITYVANSSFETKALDGKQFTLGANYTIDTDKMFLLSHTEVNLSASPVLGQPLDYYVGAENAKRIKYRADTSAAYYWWLSTPNPSGGNTERIVNTSGALGLYTSYYPYGVAAACIIQ